MPPALLAVKGLAQEPLEAAAAFYAQHLGEAQAAAAEAEGLVLVFEPAGHQHRTWRLAAVQELARASAPRVVNAVAGDDPAAIVEALHFLQRAPGVTGQLLDVHG